MPMFSAGAIYRSKRGRALSGVLLPLAIATVTAAWAGPSVFPTGTTIYDPSKAYNCDILFNPPDYSDKTYLIDMNGNVLHEWNRRGFPAKMLNPALTGGERGKIGVQLSLVPTNGKAGGINLVPGLKGMFADKTFGYMSWSGKVDWKWGTQAPRGAALQHHDWELLPDGDTLILADRIGRLRGFGKRNMLDPTIYQVSRSGRIVWSWRASRHLAELGFSGARLRLLHREATADYFHMNAMRVLGPNRWAVAGDERFAPDNILISSRNANFLAIINRRTGRIVWRLGPDFPRPAHPYGPRDHKIPYTVAALSGQHDAHMIPEGLPGAGDILVFDNEGEGGYPPAWLPVLGGSRVLQINPVTRKVVWQYTATKAAFFSPFIGSAQRLPNGNTLIDEGIWGRFFQVTPKGRIVWEYISPYARHGIRWVYRIQAVPYSWVPAGIHQEEHPVHPPALKDFHIARTEE